MDQVIEKLSEIEEAASRIIDSADSQKKLLDQQRKNGLRHMILNWKIPLQKKWKNSIPSCPASLKKNYPGCMTLRHQR